MLTDTGSIGASKELDAIMPSIPGGLVAPAPVAYSTTTEPRAAGLPGAFTDPSWLRIAPCPWPLPSAVNNAGALAATGMVMGAENCPPLLTINCVAVRPPRPKGTIVLTCPEAVYSKGAAMPSKKAWVGPNCVAKNAEVPSCAARPGSGPRFEPKMVINSPGATGPVGIPAALTNEVTAGEGRIPVRLISTVTVFDPLLATSRSGLPSPFRSTTLIQAGAVPETKSSGGRKLPVPVPSSIETVLAPVLATARSTFPSRLKSPLIRKDECAPAANVLGARNTPLPKPSNSETELKALPAPLATARSRKPLLSKSPNAREVG